MRKQQTRARAGDRVDEHVPACAELHRKRPQHVQHRCPVWHMDVVAHILKVAALRWHVLELSQAIVDEGQYEHHNGDAHGDGRRVGGEHRINGSLR